MYAHRRCSMFVSKWHVKTQKVKEAQIHRFLRPRPFQVGRKVTTLGGSQLCLWQQGCFNIIDAGVRKVTWKVEETPEGNRRTWLPFVRHHQGAQPKALLILRNDVFVLPDSFRTLLCSLVCIWRRQSHPCSPAIDSSPSSSFAQVPPCLHGHQVSSGCTLLRKSPILPS